MNFYIEHFDAETGWVRRPNGFEKESEATIEVFDVPQPWRIVWVNDNRNFFKVKQISAVIRICPQDDGTAIYSYFSGIDEDYHRIAPKAALEILAIENVNVEIAVNHPTDKHSHVEGHATMKSI
jgi:hypothetical protein